MKPEESPLEHKNGAAGQGAPEHTPATGESPRLHDRIVWFVLRCCGIKCSIEEVQVRALKPDLNKRQWHLLAADVKASSGSTLALAKDLYDAEDERIRHVDDKAKALLSATSILLTLTGAIIALTTNRESDAFRLCVCLALALLLVALFLLLGVYFGLNRFVQPVLTSATAAQLESGNQHELIRDYQKSAWLNAQVLEFLVASYRASRRVFLLSMLLLGIAGIAALFTNRPSDPIVRQLRNDPEFIRKVQGPKGDPGPPGPAGAKADSGPSLSATPAPATSP